MNMYVNRLLNKTARLIVLMLLPICCFPSTSSAQSSKKSAAGRRPNIIYIYADDLGYGDLGCYGQQKIETPNIDAFAKSGVRFTQFYAGTTVCAPSRCSLMMG